MSTRGRRYAVLVLVLVAAALVPGSQTHPLIPVSGSDAVSAPDHSEGAGFNPNQIKGLEAANPGEGVALIDAPAASATGEAKLSYPLQTPPGRAGIQPNLGLQYNSAGGNGWLGVGWDMAAPVLTVDTRWGVPRYSGGKETETYMLGGEQLTPVAHRAAPPARTAEKVFHTRVEGSFARIVRHGDAPTNYWWEVTDKKGTVSVYGSDGETRLTDATGNVATWALRETHDPNGNLMRYHYAKIFDGGVANATVPGSNLYLQRITYTGTGTTEGRYSVTFLRDRDRGEPRRPDVQIDARLGFKKVTADLLRRVEVRLDTQLIRAYEFNYRTGAFAKTLLQSVSQFDADNHLFTTHSFDYFDDIRDASGAYDAFSSSANWSVPDDGLSAGIVDGNASALQANSTDSAGGHLYVGYNPTGITKSNSAGVKVGYSEGSSEGLLALADVNGDNLPDKVFRTGGGIFYRPNLSGPDGQTRFGDTPIRLNNLPGISTEDSSSGTVGIESYFGVAAQLDYVSTTTTSDRYFADVNGDGITDLVNNGSVLFGHLDASGNPTYTANSADTPSPVGVGAVNGPVVGDRTAEFERKVDTFPLLDSVRRWVAPYDGTVAVDGRVRLVQDTSPGRAAYPKADGVRVTIQHENSELWAQRIGPNDYIEFAPTGVGSVAVHRGDALYFRVQSVLDGRYDQVAWDPRITYTSMPASTDVNGLADNSYLASRDFTLAGRPSSVVAPLTGTLRLTGDLAKTAATTDDVRVVITRGATEVFAQNVPASATGTTPIALDVPVTAGDTLSWKLRVDSPIDASALHWTPSAHYTAAQGGVPVTNQAGEPTIVINPPYEQDVYPATTLTAPQQSFTATGTGTVSVQPSLAMTGSGDARVVFTVKKRGALLGKRVIQVDGGVVPSIPALDVAVTAGDELFFDFSATDPAVLGRVSAHGATVDGATAPTAVHAAAAQGAFAQPYRGWGAIGYQGNRDRASAPIVQSDLVLDENFRDQLPDAPTEADVPGFTADPKVTAPKIVVFAPMPGQQRWAGSDDGTWVAAGGASSSRLGTDTIDVATDADFAGASAVSRRGGTEQISTTLGVGPLGGSIATGDAESTVDFLDLNGDRYPDVVGSGGVQYSDMTGGLGSTRGSLGGNVRESSSTAFTVSASGGSPARTSGTARGTDLPAGRSTANTTRSGSEMPSLGIGGNLGGGDSQTKYDLVDINGDNLPDKVYDNGEAALNLGYSFAAREPWPGGPVNTGSTRNAGVNLGFNTDYYGFAGGVSASTGSGSAHASLMDMNGDGLMDRVFAGNPVTVAINTGNGFTAPTPFRGSLAGLNTDANANFGGGAYFTFGFCFVFGCIVFNPGADASTGVGRTELALRDVNGDGYTDHVQSTKDNQLVVAENRTGRTNLLKTVNRPLGGRIDLDYSRDGNTYDQPDSRWVLARTAVFDGHPGDGQDTRLTTFRYDKGHYDRFEREFYGYGTVVTEERDPGHGDALYRSLTNTYHTDSYYTRGLLAKTSTTDAAGHLFADVVNTYQLRDVTTGGAANAASPTATVFPQLVRIDRNFYEGQATAGKSTSVEMTYDEYGNSIRTIDRGDPGAADDLDGAFGYSASDPACRARNIVGVATTLRETDGTGTVLRRRESTVDCATANVTQVRAYLADNSAAVTDMTYFPNGNLASVTDPVTKNNQRYRLDYGYDPVVGVHVESVTDSFGYRSTSTHDLRFGQPTSETDKNNQQIRRTYDPAGRVDTVTGPYEIPENRYTIDFEYHPEAAVPYAVTRHVDRAAGGVRDDTIDTITFIDGVKRLLQTKKDATVATTAGADPQDVMTVTGHTVVDFLGRTTEQFYPVTEPKGDANTAFNPGVDTVAPTRTTFDVLDRTTRSVLPDQTSTSTAYGFGPDRAGTTQFETITTDANGKAQRTYENVRHLTTAVKQFNPAGGQPVIWTSYRYDALDELTAAVDDHNNATTAAYDNFGRRTILDNPDAGRTETRYDLAGNTTQKITSKLRAAGKAIEYDYQFNRLAAVRYPTFTGNNVTYTYGAPGAADNGADRITKVTDGAGTETRAYGPLGEQTRQTRTVPDSLLNGPARTYTTSYRYDSFNRVLTLTYPDSEVLTYNYDSGGQVNRATGHKGEFDYTYLARQDYDKFNQKLLTDTGTGVRTSYTYDAADRQLTNLKAQLPDGYRFQDINYTYDNVGNILQLHNNVALPSGKPVGGPSTQTYTYDDLYQLTSAHGEYTYADNKLDRYTLTQSYDSIHNIVDKDQTHEIVVNPDTPALSSQAIDTSGSTGSLSDGAVTQPATGPDPVSTVDDPVVSPAPADDLAPLGVIEEPDPEPTAVTDPADGVVAQSDSPLADPAPADSNLATANLADSTLAASGPTVQPQRKDSYTYDYAFTGTKPHAPSKIGPINQGYDANGNLIDTVNTIPPEPGKRRQLVWDEENRLACNQDHNRNQVIAQDPSTCTSPNQPATVRYYYDDQGTRVVKIAGPQHIYPNRNYSETNGTGYKHIFIGDTRLLTKIVKPDTSYENHVFYFHEDHIGSSGYVSDESAGLTEHIEYFASGETWVNEHPGQPTPVPYQFGAKELDEETGLYYFGARYYNPRTSVWQSPDPALGSYLDGKPNNGVYDSANLASYTYAQNNPITYRDPNGMWGIVGHQLTPQAAALAVGFSPTVSRAIGAAAWAPDTDGRSATAGSSIMGSLVPGYSGADSRRIHLLTGGSAAQTQAAARARFQEVVNNMPLTGTFTEEQQNIMHAFGDSFAHVDLSTGRPRTVYTRGGPITIPPDPNCPCMFSLPAGHAFTADGGHQPDNPNLNPGQYRQYLGGLYDVLSVRAQREHLTPRMTRDQFVNTMMREVAGTAGETRQIQAANAVIGRMENPSP
ncbi:SpvB/TcaC N-terminal domain-containing protein [Labedaea rhizosphaerae]|uniref:RHS repeat-associated protein n=1 Tax=Labedaea rhizosphaerae TaxID=598644 RepID=A0A4R6SE15_LABRH|nr:SpvB/TcaC N-terminal domain-containing protein [Labedaea rhizosphaerae]TDP98132.1 RHS repeat-associated protein [Labedaea rhizosphaerae]